MLFLALVLWCLVLLWVRTLLAGSAMYLFLLWNLFLAAIPLLASGRLMRERRPEWALSLRDGLWLGVWLLFLPNAPYLLTDFVHLRHRPPVPFWYDLAVILSCAGTGLVFPYASLARVLAQPPVGVHRVRMADDRQHRNVVRGVAVRGAA